MKGIFGLLRSPILKHKNSNEIKSALTIDDLISKLTCDSQIDRSLDVSKSLIKQVYNSLCQYLSVLGGYLLNKAEKSNYTCYPEKDLNPLLPIDSNLVSQKHIVTD